MDIESFTEFIKDKCSEVGFSKSGIAPVKYHKEDREHLEGWIKNGYHASMNWMENNIEKRTNILNVVTEEIDPTLGNARYYIYRELNCNDVDLDWDIDRVIDNLRTMSVIIYQELNTDIRGDPN